MSQDYRFYNDRWRTTKIEDEPADLSSEFEATQMLMAEIASMLSSQKVLSEDMEYLITIEMAKAVFGSNKIERLGLGLDETMRLCLEIFEGKDLDIEERRVTSLFFLFFVLSLDTSPLLNLSEDYQARLDDFVLKNTNPGEQAVIRSRREVVQHAAAFQYIVNAFVKHEQPMSEALIKETHAILVKGLGKEEAGIISNKDIRGTYRHHEAFAGSLRYTKANEIPKAMNSLISNLHNDLSEIEKSSSIDPFMLAAKYGDRFVNVHPFRDGNSRMCRLILNAILIKYAGIVVVLGEKDRDRDEYLQVAQEITIVKGASRSAWQDGPRVSEGYIEKVEDGTYKETVMKILIDLTKKPRQNIL